MRRPDEMAKSKVEQANQKWQTISAAIRGWGTTVRLAVILLVLQVPADVAYWLASRR